MKKISLLAALAVPVLVMIGCGSGQPDMNTEEAKKAFEGEPMPPEAADFIAKKQQESAQKAQEHAQQMQQQPQGN